MDVKWSIQKKKPIEIVQNYTYLRTLISSTGNVSLASDNLKEKAPFLANKISTQWFIQSVLTRNSEVWRAYTKSDLKSWDSSQIEKSHPM